MTSNLPAYMVPDSGTTVPRTYVQQSACYVGAIANTCAALVPPIVMILAACYTASTAAACLHRRLGKLHDSKLSIDLPTSIQLIQLFGFAFLQT